jgi:hypothetical protein
VSVVFWFMLFLWPQQPSNDPVWTGYCIGEKSWSTCFGDFIISNPTDHYEEFYLKKDGGVLGEMDRLEARKHVLTTT